MLSSEKKEIPELVHGYIPEKETAAMAAGGAGEGEFYLRYYVGHKGKFGHEFLEFEFRPDGKLRYANNSNYKNDTMIRKEVFISPSVLREARRIIQESEVRRKLVSTSSIRFLGLLLGFSYRRLLVA
jgi:hypothetical protein